jgi:hypothetical protein
MLFKKANVYLIINKVMSDSFKLQQSIRQGCPLSPFLCALIVDALGYLLHKVYHMKLIKGIFIPWDKVAIKSHFVDDSMLFLHNFEEEVNNTLDILQLYCDVSGSLIAHNKTDFLMFYLNPIPHWISKYRGKLNVAR